MESASSLFEVPQTQTPPRKGQIDIVRAVLQLQRGVLTAQLPTGYGKTKAAILAFIALHRKGEVTRLLYVVSSEPQLTQFCQDAEGDFAWGGMAGVKPLSIGYSHSLALKEHRTNKTMVFVTTIQALAYRTGKTTENGGNTLQTIRDLLATGRWMIVIDEYHHYGMEKAWGKTALTLNAQLLLALSATPDRKGQDSAFGTPMIRMPYLAALEEKAVKRLTLHAYEYRVDAIRVNGEPISFTTSELVDEVGSDEPELIDRYLVSKKIRWSPKYISPLVSIPIERLLTKRVRSGLPLQMIISAMGCLHAQMVYHQVSSLFGDLLRVDWVGTGPHGRRPEENKAVINKFCPAKKPGVPPGKNIQLDVLIHVGVAGEGLDSIFVAEVVHLHSARLGNREDQENGRAARRLPVIDDEYQQATINVDTTSAYAKWKGAHIMEVFDRVSDAEPLADDEEEDEEPQEPSEYEDLPDEPRIVITDLNLINIYRGEAGVQAWARAISQAAGKTLQEIAAELDGDDSHPLWALAIKKRRQELHEQGQASDRMSELLQLRQQVDAAVGKVASMIVRTLNEGRFERSAIGDMMKRINTRKKRLFGDVDTADEALLRTQYHFIKDLEQAFKQGERPAWLL